MRGDAKDLEALSAAMAGHDLTIHLASNPHIAAAMIDSAIDFHQGTLITHHVVEAMRRCGAPRIGYAAVSGAYGDLGKFGATEDQGPLIPVSTYGASKLAGEDLVSAYAYMFGVQGRAFRFGNVVGRRHTHRVDFDFLRRLGADPRSLHVVGDGSRSNCYILAPEVVAAVLKVLDDGPGDPFATYDVADGRLPDRARDRRAGNPGDGPRALGGDRQVRNGGACLEGDVPIVRLSTERIKSLGWRPSTGSAGALLASMRAMIEDLDAGCGSALRHRIGSREP